jgi:hypothetical protein
MAVAGLKPPVAPAGSSSLGPDSGQSAQKLFNCGDTFQVSASITHSGIER